MYKKITKIVLTGGPCGGKTNSLSTIEQRLNELGYKVLIVPEAATEIINNAVKPWEQLISNKKFQSFLLEYQIAREKTYLKIAKEMKHNKIVILFDRGTVDGKAYITEEEFSEILREKELTEEELKSRYNAVIHLRTAAIGAEEFYTLKNNKARSDSKQKAIDLDNKLVSAWTGHNNFKIIDNSTDFEEKIERVLKEVLMLLNEPVPIKIEKKFLVKKPDLEKLLEQENCQKLFIKQTYLLSNDKKVEKRLRQIGKDGNYSYFYGIKQHLSGSTSSILEEKINKKEYNLLRTTADSRLKEITKERYCFVYNNLYFKLDIYHFWKYVAILEVELTEENQEFETPFLINVIRDVTDDKNFKNIAIAKKIPLV